MKPLILTTILTICALAKTASPPIMPNPRLTPGDVLGVMMRDICVVGYTNKVRNVPESVKRKVYAEYGITSHQPREYEVDHLISLELGGSNSIRNLWPESYLTSPYNAHVKDVLENKLHRMVCSRQIDLRTAQRAIATDWISAYHKYVYGQSPGPLASNQRPRAARTQTVTPSGPKTLKPQPQPQPPPQRSDSGIGNNAPMYSRYPGKTGRIRSAPQDPADVAQQEPPPDRVPVQSRRRPSKHCKLKNLWCGFGLLR